MASRIKMRPMTRLAPLLLLIACSATASPSAPGFFPRPGHEEAADVEADVIRKIQLADATFGCSIQMRYNAPTPNLITLGYVGGSTCSATHETAINAAAGLFPKAAAIGGEPAIPPIYQCSITVLWDPSAPAAVSLAFAGTSCDGSRGSALDYARYQVACMHRTTPCSP